MSLQKKTLLECDCGCGFTPCCGRALPKDCFTGVASTDINALPMTLHVELSATPSYGDYSCFDGEGDITFKTPFDEGGLCCWEGRISGTCVNCNGETYNWYVDIVVCCGDTEPWFVGATPSLPCVMGVGGHSGSPTSCALVLLEGCFEQEIVGCVTACIDTMPPTSGPVYTLCYLIYELP